ncbi:hypothetical protein [Agromyces sp. LHK192]|uniref:hypothetical protein n=1 Tax=Agromyces sp. LHK192 TaxID=2498704 RepID=UPI000FDB3D15|nr:hypothetical protein [Agromyces sp. LHK192]
MLTLVPDPQPPGTRVAGTGTDHGVRSEISVEVPLVDGGRVITLRTIARLGQRFTEDGSPHGVLTDAVSVANLAAVSWMLQTFPNGLPRPEFVTLMESIHAEADAVASDRGSWTATSATIAGADYALWHRPHGDGFIAHLDVGDRVMAAWGPGRLPSLLRRLQLVDLPDGLRP